MRTAPTAVRAGIEQVRKKAAVRPAPSLVEGQGKAAESRRAKHAEGLAAMTRVLGLLRLGRFLAEELLDQFEELVGFEGFAQ